MVTESHIERFNTLVLQAEDMSERSESQKREADEHAVLVGSDFAEGVSRIETALKQIETLLDTQPGEPPVLNFG